MSKTEYPIASLVTIQEERYVKVLNETKINICTCGDCGSIILIDTENDDLENIKCPFCAFKGEYCDFPDLYY